jgi:Cu-processing system permease protein
MTATLALIFSSFREARRNRVTLIVGVFALVLLFSTTVVLNTTVFTLNRVVNDFGLAVMSILLVGLAIFLSSGLIAKEIERRTIFLIVSRPISRAQFVVGRFFGNALTLAVLLVVMSGVFYLQLVAFDVPRTGAQLASIVGLYFELLFLTALGLLCSSMSGQLVAGLTTISVYLLGHLSDDLLQLSMRSKSPALAQIGAAAHHVLPNLNRLDYRMSAAYELTIDWSQVGKSCIYISAYAVILLVATVFAFERRDFK